MEKRGLTGMGIWNTKDYKGQPVTWYSADIVEKYKKILEETKEFLNEIYEDSEADTYIARAYDLIIKIERVIK